MKACQSFRPAARTVSVTALGFFFFAATGGALQGRRGTSAPPRARPERIVQSKHVRLRAGRPRSSGVRLCCGKFSDPSIGKRTRPGRFRFVPNHPRNARSTKERNPGRRSALRVRSRYIDVTSQAAALSPPRTSCPFPPSRLTQRSTVERSVPSARATAAIETCFTNSRRSARAAAR